MDRIPASAAPAIASSGSTSLVAGTQANTCYFRTAVAGDGRKALIQITERCNLHCAHCFVSSTRHGSDMTIDQITGSVLPRLSDARVERVTLTGGEPFVHPDILAICTAAVEAGMAVGICTNATCVTDEQIDVLAALERVHVNVSFDGFRAESHGRFRGNPASFDTTVATTRKLAAKGLLQGLLSTPNRLTTPEDYTALAEFGAAVGAEYLLMNPLSAFGRGVRSRKRLANDERAMHEVLINAQQAAGSELEVVPIRFPNSSGSPLAPCIAGDIIYVFTDGSVAACPYLVFAARTPQSRHDDSEFIVGDIFDDDIAGPLDGFSMEGRHRVSEDPTCTTCTLASNCGRGCPAAVVADGGLLGERDVEPCPVP
jgi:radical SAM protein with 4Fe4S-binding SPASM domain